MKTRALGLGLVVILATAVSGLAETFPLTFKTVSRQELRTFPGTFGNFGQLRLQKPPDLQKEPKPISKAPLYAQCSGPTPKNLIARLDESTDGKGYDRLILDLNLNGDLTDDPVASTDETAGGGLQDRTLEFGPIRAPANLGVCGGVPQLVAQVYVSNNEYLRSGADRANMYAGQIMLKAAWYLTAKVKLNGRSRVVGVYDASGNFKLGDGPRYSTYKREGQPDNWYVGGGDTFMLDADGSGAFETDRLGSETVALAPLIFLDNVPYKVSLAPDCTSLTLEQWSEPMAEVSLEPKGEQVRSVTLAWQRSEEQWELLRPAVLNGKFKVPPGEYRLFSCALVGQKGGTSTFASAYDRIVRDVMHFETGKPNKLQCGGTLDIQVSAEKRAPRPYENMGLNTDRNSSDFVLAINANVMGAGGEAYNSYGTGAKFAKSPPKPSFVITDARGARVGNGNLEFG